jgi:hypothetical protein
MIKPFKYKLVLLAVLVTIAAWQAFIGFQEFFALTSPELSIRDNLLWFYSGPISFFLAVGIGLLFALGAATARHPTSKKFWRFSLWLPAIWLALGAIIFTWIDYFGKGFRSSVPQHIWHTVIIAFPMALGTACLLSVSSLVRRTVDVPATSPETPWKRVAATCARILAWSSVAIGSIVAVLASAILLLMASCTPPSITTLAGRFPNQRADLETIIRMSDQDPDLAVIDPGWLNSRSGQQVLGDNDPKSPLSVQRWNEYRRIFKRNDLTQGLRRFKQNGDAFIIVKSEGLLDRGYSNGYVFCGSDSEHTLPPCLSKDPRGEHTTSQGGEAYSFIKVADRWYVFSQGPG